MGKFTEFPQYLQTTASLAKYFLFFFQGGIDNFTLALDPTKKEDYREHLKVKPWNIASVFWAVIP